MKLLNYIILLCFLWLPTASISQTISNCASCNESLLTIEELPKFSLESLQLLRNEIFARNGYSFNNTGYQSYFEEKNWYESKRDNSQVQLNKTAQTNVQLLQKLENELIEYRKDILYELHQLKQDILYNDEYKLVDEFNQELDGFDYLKTAMKQLNLDNLNWYNNQGLHKVTIDNGHQITIYSIAIWNREISITHNLSAKSELLDNTYIHYASESEFSITWIFKFDQRKINFVRTEIAG